MLASYRLADGLGLCSVAVCLAWFLESVYILAGNWTDSSIAFVPYFNGVLSPIALFLSPDPLPKTLTMTHIL